MDCLERLDFSGSTEQEVIQSVASQLLYSYRQARKRATSRDVKSVKLVWEMHWEAKECSGLTDARRRWRVLRDWPFDEDEKPAAKARMKILEVIGKKLVDFDKPALEDAPQ